MGFSAKSFDSTISQRTQKAWETQIADFSTDEDVVLIGEYRRILSSLLKHNNDTDDGFIYALVDDSKGYAQAILEIVHAGQHSRAPWLKLLSIYLEPRLDVDRRSNGINLAVIREASVLLAEAITNALTLTFTDHPSNQLKVYGRSDHMKGFLEFIASDLDESIAQGLAIEMQGRWLVFNKQT